MQITIAHKYAHTHANTHTVLLSVHAPQQVNVHADKEMLFISPNRLHLIYAKQLQFLTYATLLLYKCQAYFLSYCM